MQPVISILLPFRNAAPWLAECLSSITSQSFPDWECILVNDHSTDASLQIATGFALSDGRFHIHMNEGNGLLDAYQTLLKHANGKYITRMDADDIMAEIRLASMKAILVASGPKTVATGKVRFFPEEKCGIGTRFYENWLNELCEKDNHADWIWRECVIPSPCWMARKEEIIQIGGFDGLEYPEDYDLAFRFITNHFSIKSVKEICHFWRQHEQRFSLTNNYSAENFMRMKWKYFKQNELPKFQHLVLLGTGDKAKLLKTILQVESIQFTWISHEKKVAGNIIHGIKIGYLYNTIFEKNTAVISTLSSIDNFETVYEEIIKQNAEVYRFC